jgi:aryl-alcohol dehydrogenase-like predicted oxidoreductase
MFGELHYDPARAYAAVGLEEQLEALGDAVAAGKVRAVGLSNETAWGLTAACHLGAPRGAPGARAWG